jgi:putative ABC transport system permease protein
MRISVLERRSEIGLRRALSATGGQIRIQFLAEAILLSPAGGAARAAGRHRPRGMVGAADGRRYLPARTVPDFLFI